mmetsp:Transcript_19128/g.39284  ORF Transcript_19128/g.39284 Transcript_19128/m.39284 type:complete len:124 (+) Transcript_19128:779-1150(+)
MYRIVFYFNNSLLTEAGARLSFLSIGFRVYSPPFSYHPTLFYASRIYHIYHYTTRRVDRLLERGKDSGRADDAIEVIRKRFKTHIESTVPILDRFEKGGTTVHTIDSARSVNEVYASVSSLFW